MTCVLYHHKSIFLSSVLAVDIFVQYSFVICFAVFTNVLAATTCTGFQNVIVIHSKQHYLILYWEEHFVKKKSAYIDNVLNDILDMHGRNVVPYFDMT